MTRSVGADFHGHAEIHDQQALGDVRKNRKIVRDVYAAEVEPRREASDQIEDARADRDVEHGKRLVRDDELGLQHERAGNADPLTLAAAHLMGKAVPVFLGLQADELERLQHPPSDLRLAPKSQRARPFGHEIKYAEAGIERFVRVLKNQLYPAPIILQTFGVEAADVLAVEADRAVRRLVQFGDQEARGRLAAAGFTGDAQDLPLLHRQRDPVDGLDQLGLLARQEPCQQPRVDLEMLGQAVQLEDCHVLFSLACRRIASTSSRR